MRKLIYTTSHTMWLMKEVYPEFGDRYIAILKNQGGRIIMLDDKIYEFLLHSVFRNTVSGYDGERLEFYYNVLGYDKI